MANRLGAPNQFETLTNPLASNLDQNFTQNQSAWNDSSLGFLNGIPTDTGSANNYSVTLPYGSPSAYNTGMTVAFIPANTNTGASVMTVSPLGSLAIQTPGGNALLGGEIVQGRTCVLIVNAGGTAFQISGPCPALSTASFGAGGITLNCAGCTSVMMALTMTAAGGNITLSNLGFGVPVVMSVANTSGGSANFAIKPVAPSGTTYAAVWVVTGGGIGTATNIVTGTGSLSLSSGQSRILSGMTIGAPGPLALYFS